MVKLYRISKNKTKEKREKLNCGVIVKVMIVRFVEEAVTWDVTIVCVVME